MIFTPPASTRSLAASFAVVDSPHSVLKDHRYELHNLFERERCLGHEVELESVAGFSPREKKASRLSEAEQCCPTSPILHIPPAITCDGQRT